MKDLRWPKSRAELEGIPAPQVTLLARGTIAKEFGNCG